MNISIEEKKKEAVARMLRLGIFPLTIQQFIEEDHVSISEPPHGAFYWAKGEDLDRIQQFEKKYNVLVYMVVRSYTNFGKMDSFLFVSDYPQEWDLDWNDLPNKAVAYVYNHDVPAYSETGFIGLAPTAGRGLRRTW